MRNGRPIVNLVGKKFNRLTGEKFHHQGKGGLAYFKFVCECGRRKVLCGTDVSNGKTKSCGCLKRTVEPENIGRAAAHMLYCTYKYNAKSRGLDFSLSEVNFLSITKMPCKYCGIYPEKEYRGANKKSSPYVYNGIDRVDNLKGYIRKNCVPCCSVCNQAKHNLSISAFQKWVRRIAPFQKS